MVHQQQHRCLQPINLVLGMLANKHAYHICMCPAVPCMHPKGQKLAREPLYSIYRYGCSQGRAVRARPGARRANKPGETNQPAGRNLHVSSDHSLLKQLASQWNSYHACISILPNPTQFCSASPRSIDSGQPLMPSCGHPFHSIPSRSSPACQLAIGG